MNYYDEKLQQINSDKYQRDAYLSNKTTIVLAGPGSGKTTVLTIKVKRLLDNYIAQKRKVACITFSKEAAVELSSRLNKLSENKYTNIYLGTVHSFCLNEIILPFGHLYNKRIPFPLSLISNEEGEDIINRIKDKKGMAENEEIDLTLINSIRTLDITCTSSVKENIDETLLKISRLYERIIRIRKKVDYISFTKYATQLVQENEYVRKSLEARFPWILIDEYQDLGKPIHEIVLCLMKKTNIKLFIVGDLDQSIYSFQGGNPQYLNELYNMMNINSIRLINNYRSAPEIIKGSEVVLGINRNYVSKNILITKAEYEFINCLRGIEDQYKYIANYIIPQCVKNKIKMKEIIILVSSNPQAKKLGEILDNNKIGYYISQHDYNRSDFIIWLENICKWILNCGDITFNDLYGYWCKMINNIDYYKVNGEFHNRKKLYFILRNSIEESFSLLNLINFILDKLGILNIFTELDNQEELKNIKKLKKSLSSGMLKNYDIKRFSNNGRDDNQLTISTRHSSKGLEFDVVVMPGLDEYIFPKYKSKNLAEERRICFVCVSRARKKCYLLHSKHYWNNKYSEWKNRNPSVFFENLYSKYGRKDNTIDLSEE